MNMQADGFVVTGMTTEQLVRALAERGQAHEMLRCLLEVFGMNLQCSERARYHMEVVVRPEYQVGMQIAQTLTMALYPRGKWLDYSMVFRMHEGAVEIATQGVTERSDEDMRERWVASYWERTDPPTYVQNSMNAAPQWAQDAYDVTTGRAPTGPCRSCGAPNSPRDLGSGGPYRCGSPDCVVF